MSPGFWKNWDNHFTSSEFQMIIQGTAHFSGLSIAQAAAILNDNSNQYLRHLLSAELNVSWNPELGDGLYDYGSLAGYTVEQILDLAFDTAPEDASADLVNAVLYLGSEGEEAGESCRVVDAECGSLSPASSDETSRLRWTRSRRRRGRGGGAGGPPGLPLEGF